ncbi:MAG TPA: monofunctional biosynthetic peptidoglycan transglycosylase [Steroidobacteraceae bacterium]|nr:monofunctional biosynthetic peptidoglycan transglycosylase [Steroidobacteraceae bacterium]
MAKRSLARRIIRLLLWIVALWFAATILTVLALRWVDPPTSAFMMNARFEALAAGDRHYRSRYEWVDYARISPNAAIAVIAAEDQRFSEHSGFDLESIDESIREHQRGKRLRGASTISQQVAKNLFLWNEHSFTRKAFEAYFTVLIETLWTKQRILEMYLNIAEFGRDTYGVGAASKYCFGKSAARLTPEEGALLAAVLPNPRRLNVRMPSMYVRQRQDWILWQMHALGGRSYLLAFESP